LRSIVKRLFDISFSIIGLFLFSWVLLLAWISAIIDTRSNGIFTQERIGQFGKGFKIYKLRSIQIEPKKRTLQISKMGRFLRNYKLDELPQLINVLKGEMSIVGPRPDIVGYYDTLEGENRKILELKPGLTSTASLKYYSEDTLLGMEDDPLYFNDNVIFPDKIKMNLDYYYHQSFLEDLKIIGNTCKLIFKRVWI
jgi:lipopolysaccharide/colanic/teichoic acid biosynthesis glycosyltransferase